MKQFDFQITSSRQGYSAWREINKIFGANAVDYMLSYLKWNDSLRFGNELRNRVIERCRVLHSAHYFGFIIQ